MSWIWIFGFAATMSMIGCGSGGKATPSEQAPRASRLSAPTEVYTSEYNPKTGSKQESMLRAGQGSRVPFAVNRGADGSRIVLAGRSQEQEPLEPAHRLSGAEASALSREVTSRAEPLDLKRLKSAPPLPQNVISAGSALSQNSTSMRRSDGSTVVMVTYGQGDARPEGVVIYHEATDPGDVLDRPDNPFKTRPVLAMGRPVSADDLHPLGYALFTLYDRSVGIERVYEESSGAWHSRRYRLSQ